MTRSALETVTLYLEQIWNGGRDDLIPELCADPIVRHDPNALTALSHAEQRARIRHNYDELRPVFTWEILAGDDRHITLVWNVTGRDPAWKLCGIEIFRVENGRITNVWNAPYVAGRWGQACTLSARAGDGPDEPCAILGMELTADGGDIIAPVDGQHMTRWIEQLLGAPESMALDGGRWRHLYSPDRSQAPSIALTIAEQGQPTTTVPQARITWMTLGLEANGLVNATIRFVGQSITGEQAGAGALPGKVSRLSRTSGALDRSGATVGLVVDGSLGFGPGGADAGGSVTIRLNEGLTASDAEGAGRLTLGWEGGDGSLHFHADVEIIATSRSFADDQGTEAIFTWRASRLGATLVNGRP